MNPTTHRSLQKEYFAFKKKYKKQVKLMHMKYKNDLFNEINGLSWERGQDLTNKRKHGRGSNPHIYRSMDTTFSTITL